MSVIDVYDSAKVRIPAISELVELWRYRDLLQLLITNRIKTRYKRSVLGVAWTLLNPLLNTLVITIAFSQLFRFDIKNYPIYLLIGLLFWNFFAQTTNDSMQTLIWGSSLIKRIYIPRTIFAVAVVGNGIVNFLLAIVPLTIIMIGMQQPLRPSMLFLPIVILIMSMFTLGFSLFISTLAVFFVDVVDMYSVVLSAWFYLTPIIYPISIIPQGLIAYFKFNPLYPMVDLFRTIIYSGEVPSLIAFSEATGIAVVTLIIGWWVFTKRVDEFAYRI